eukprot:CAMPEP_0197074454 /NCGR_PEP_ID=MMETSP1384-20130603/211117_1 /TAXON_ID=29189 /ORGANISM="Ammonia sp." /LENGTH=401 /DNA_ID=CAMNT_0042513295 /DNA_START=113 /DNA_END=1314 /DNA_ORIENTATION=-
MATQLYLLLNYLLLLSLFCQFYAIFQSTPLAVHKCTIRMFVLFFVALPLCNILHPYIFINGIHHRTALWTPLLCLYFLLIWITMVCIISLHISKLRQAHSMDTHDQTLIAALHKAGLLGIVCIVFHTVCPILLIVSFQAYMQSAFAMHWRLFVLLFDISLTLITSVLSDNLFDAIYKKSCGCLEELCCETKVRLSSSSLESVFAARSPDTGNDSMFMEVSSKRNTITAHIAAYRPSVTAIAVNHTSAAVGGTADSIGHAYRPSVTAIAVNHTSPAVGGTQTPLDTPRSEQREPSATVSQFDSQSMPTIQAFDVAAVDRANGGKLATLDIIQEQQPEDEVAMNGDAVDSDNNQGFQIQMAECNAMVSTDGLTPRSVANQLTLRDEVRSGSEGDIDDDELESH